MRPNFSKLRFLVLLLYEELPELLALPDAIRPLTAQEATTRSFIPNDMSDVPRATAWTSRQGFNWTDDLRSLRLSWSWYDGIKLRHQLSASTPNAFTAA
jgi:hypothetical protein